MHQLIRIAASQEIQVHVSHLPESIMGYWSPDERRIYYDMKLTPNESRVTVAHELGHAHYGHRDDSDRNERAADRFAASLLIDPEHFAQVEAVSPDPHFIADELSVTADLVLYYEEHCLTRLRGVTYAHARHGSRQWAYKGMTA